MSYDRQIDQVCPHLVVEEALFVQGTNFNMVRPLRPISSIHSLSIRVNGSIEVPSQGAQIPISVEGTKVGPFNITPSTNTLTLQVGTASPQTITLPLANQVSPSRVVSYLNSGLQGVSFFVTQDQKRIGFKSNDSGRSARVFIVDSSTLTSVLGLTKNREYRGRQVAPGWTLVNDPTTLTGRSARLIVFDEPFKGFQDFVEVNYSTVRQECRRCGGLGVENDWVYGVDGEVGQVRDEALLIQELNKIMYTHRGSNPFNVWYGSNLLDQIGSKVSAGSVLTKNTISQDVHVTFGRWQSIKKQQEQSSGEPVSDREYPFQLLSADIEQSTQDPTVIFLTITVANRSTDPIQLQRGLKLPEPVNLLGATAAQGIFRQSLSNFALVQ